MHSNISRVARAVALLGALSVAVACADGAAAPTAPVTSPDPSLAKGGPNMLPTRGLIVFHAELTGDFELYTVEEDGSNLRRLTYREGRDLYPSWSPDGRRIAFIREADEKADIWVMNADGSGAKRLTMLEARWYELTAPRWSPDGKLLTFGYRDASNNPDVYLIGSNGRNLVRLTNAPTSEWTPTFSPDGKRIAYTTQEYVSGPARIYSMNIDGTDASQLVPCVSNDGCSHPAYSPDGTTVAYAEETALRTYRLSGGGAPSTIAADAAVPAWSPDGTKLVYTTVFQNLGELRTVGANGGAYTIISPPNANAGAGSWKR